MKHQFNHIVRTFVAWLVCLTISLPAVAQDGQEMTVKSFQPALMDVSAYANPVNDLNGQKCALIKVQCVLPDLKFKGNVIGTPADKDGEYWVYVTRGTKSLLLQANLVRPMYVDLSQYLGDGVGSGVTYYMVVEIPQALYNAVIANVASKSLLKPKKVSVDSTKIFNGYLAKAQQGDAEAQYMVSLCYAQGQGVAANGDEAGRWMFKAAENGWAEAQLTLGCMISAQNGYENGKSWILKAAEQGYAPAQYMYGTMYSYGFGVPKDNKEALKWLRKAAAQGNADAIFSLGDMYRYGDGVKKDPNEAYRYLSKAAEQGHPYAIAELGDCYKEGIAVAVNYSEALKYYHQSIDLGYSGAYASLGNCYSEGIGVPQDIVEAARLYKKGADLGNDSCMYLIANCYVQGKGVNQNFSQAVSYYRQAAQKNHTPSMVKLGDMLANGRGVVKPDYFEAAMWLHKAADAGNADGMILYGLCLTGGLGVEKNQSAGLDWINKGKANGSTLYDELMRQNNR